MAAARELTGANGKKYAFDPIVVYPDAELFQRYTQSKLTAYTYEQVCAAVDQVNAANLRYAEFIVAYYDWMDANVSEDWNDWLKGGHALWTPLMHEVEDILRDFDTREVSTQTPKRHSSEYYALTRWAKDVTRLNKRVEKLEKLFTQIKADNTAKVQGETLSAHGDSLCEHCHSAVVSEVGSRLCVNCARDHENDCDEAPVQAPTPEPTYIELGREYARLYEELRKVGKRPYVTFNVGDMASDYLRNQIMVMREELDTLEAGDLCDCGHHDDKPIEGLCRNCYTKGVETVAQIMSDKPTPEPEIFTRFGNLVTIVDAPADVQTPESTTQALPWKQVAKKLRAKVAERQSVVESTYHDFLKLKEAATGALMTMPTFPTEPEQRALFEVVAKHDGFFRAILIDDIWFRFKGYYLLGAQRRKVWNLYVSDNTNGTFHIMHSEYEVDDLWGMIERGVKAVQNYITRRRYAAFRTATALYVTPDFEDLTVLDVDEVCVTKVGVQEYTLPHPNGNQLIRITQDDPRYAKVAEMIQGWQVSDENDLLVYYRRPGVDTDNKEEGV